MEKIMFNLGKKFYNDPSTPMPKFTSAELERHFWQGFYRAEEEEEMMVQGQNEWAEENM